MRRSEGPVALVWPPVWTYTSAPADLTETGAQVAALGAPVRLWDLSAGLLSHLLAGPELDALRRWETYADPAAQRAVAAGLEARAAAIGARHGVRYAPRLLAFPDIDEDHIPGAWKVGLDPARNPALPFLDAAAGRVLADDPAVVAIGLGFPTQRTCALVFARLLRARGYRGSVVLYTSLQDEIAPEDFAPDLEGEPRHLLFTDLDGAIVGEAEAALAALWRAVTGQGALSDVPNLLSPRTGLVRPPRQLEALGALAPAAFVGLDAAVYPTPTPVVDLRLGRGCPWGRCTFCAIHVHQPGYRAGSVQRLAAGMQAAYDAVGARFFRVRDDLVTPRQLREIADVAAALPFGPRWSARVRFEDALTNANLAYCAERGLEELWIGLESASERVRALMDKGVSAATVERVLDGCAAAGIRVRALCLLGHPGETAAEALQTVDFLLANQHRIAAASLSPFQLMRRSILGEDPRRFGLTLLPDPLPRHARLRFAARARWDGQITAAQMAPVLARIEADLLPTLRGELLPDAAHGWIAASVRRRPSR